MHIFSWGGFTILPNWGVRWFYDPVFPSTRKSNGLKIHISDRSDSKSVSSLCFDSPRRGRKNTGRGETPVYRLVIARALKGRQRILGIRCVALSGLCFVVSMNGGYTPVCNLTVLRTFRMFVCCMLWRGCNCGYLCDMEIHKSCYIRGVKSTNV